jgi:5-methylcytosine-specific restriction endonuclease McrA
MARFEDIVGDDPQKRTFTRELKRKLFQRSPTCQLCNQEILDMDDSEVHHLEEYWRGGKTIPENAALTHRFCNKSHGGGRK